MAIESVLSQVRRNWDHSPNFEQAPLGLGSSHLEFTRPKPTLYNLTFDHLLRDHGGRPGGGYEGKGYEGSPIGSPIVAGRDIGRGHIGSGLVGRSASASPSGMDSPFPATPASYRPSYSKSLLEEPSPVMGKSASATPSRMSSLDRNDSLQDLCTRRIVMSRPLEGRKLGLAVKDLHVLAVCKPEAWSYGWRVGDRVLAINGNRVLSQDAFNFELSKAMDMYFSHMLPLSFDIFREFGGAAAEDAPCSEALGRRVAFQPGFVELGPPAWQGSYASRQVVGGAAEGAMEGAGFQRRRQCCC